MGGDVPTQLPIGIVSWNAADWNIAAALGCGKTVEYAKYRLRVAEKWAPQGLKPRREWMA